MRSIWPNEDPCMMLDKLSAEDIKQLIAVFDDAAHETNGGRSTVFDMLVRLLTAAGRGERGFLELRAAMLELRAARPRLAVSNVTMLRKPA